MNVNPLIIELSSIVGCPVVPDLYLGDADRWIVFTYEDERGALYGDNFERYTQVTVQVTYYTPSGYNFMADKKKIKNALVDRNFQVQSIQSWVEPDKKTSTYVRHTVFTVNYVGVE